ncbi:hypothetical protein B9D92_21890, partial [Mycobacterium tuberculosis]
YIITVSLAFKLHNNIRIPLKLRVIILTVIISYNLENLFSQYIITVSLAFKLHNNIRIPLKLRVIILTVIISYN